MRTTCLSCGGPLLPLKAYGHWSACPKCEHDWLKSITITLPALNLQMGGGLLLDKGVPTRNGGA